MVFIYLLHLLNLAISLSVCDNIKQPLRQLLTGTNTHQDPSGWILRWILNKFVHNWTICFTSEIIEQMFNYGTSQIYSADK